MLLGPQAAQTEDQPERRLKAIFASEFLEGALKSDPAPTAPAPRQRHPILQNIISF